MVWQKLERPEMLQNGVDFEGKFSLGVGQSRLILSEAEDDIVEAISGGFGMCVVFCHGATGTMVGRTSLLRDCLVFEVKAPS